MKPTKVKQALPGTPEQCLKNFVLEIGSQIATHKNEWKFSILCVASSSKLNQADIWNIFHRYDLYLKFTSYDLDFIPAITAFRVWIQIKIQTLVNEL